MDDQIARNLCDSTESTNGSQETSAEIPNTVTMSHQDTAWRACEARFRSLYEHAPIGIALINAHGTILQSNPALQKILGYSAEELRHLSFADVTHPDDLAAELVLHAQVLTGQRDSFSMNKRYIHKDGHIVWGHLAAAVTRHPDGTPASMIGMLLDLTGHQQAVPPLRQSEERFRVLLEQVTDLVSIVDRAGHHTYVSPSYQTVLGYDPTHLLGRPFFELLHPDDRPTVEAQWPHWLAHVGEPLRFEIRVRHANGSWRWLDAQVHLAFDEPAVGGLIAAARDITERKRSEAELQHLALHDALTGLPNRTYLQERLEHCLLHAPYEQTHLALLFLDLNRFSEVNEAVGHVQGDLLLQRLAGRLHSVLPAIDTVARLGSDEFAFVAWVDDVAGAGRVAETVQRALDAPFAVDGQSLRLTASIGMALYPEHAGDAQGLWRSANVALATAKRQRAPVVFYSLAQDAQTQSHRALISALRDACARDAFVLHYQPIIDLTSGQVSHVEALVRWNRPGQGLVQPAVFVPLAEEVGLIDALTACVLRRALYQCRAWQRRGLDLSVAVNLSMVNLRDPHLLETILNLLQTCEVAPSRLHLELTETALMADQEAALAVLTRLSQAGVRLAVDDFGTGYSALANLARLPVDELKIDRSFVQRISAHESDAVIVAATIGLGRGLGLRVVAEGVEDAQTLATLAALDCDAVQGYHISPALPPDEVEAWLRARKRSFRRE